MDESEKLKNKELSLKLRELAFNTKISDLKDIQPIGDYGIYGVIMEMGYPQGFGTVACYITGDASIYFSNGGGMLGGIDHQTVKNAALSFIQTSLNFITAFKKTCNHSFPKDAHTNFYILTQDGIYTTEAFTDDLGNKRSELSPLFFAGQAIITAYRLIEKKKEG